VAGLRAASAVLSMLIDFASDKEDWLASAVQDVAPSIIRLRRS
jgi:hypothetical protein